MKEKQSYIDVHTHGLGGYDTRTHDPVDILAMAALQAAAGVSAFVPTIYPAPVEEMRAQMAAVREAMALQRAVSQEERSPSPSPADGDGTDKGIGNSEFEIRNPGLSGARILGVHLEGPFLNPARCGALNPASFLQASLYQLERLLEGFDEIVRIVTIAPEIEGALRLINALSDRGILVSMGHSDATYAQAEAGFHSGAGSVTHLFNAMRGFHHREPGLAGFGLMHEHTFAEVIADLAHLHEKTLEMIFRVKPPEKIVIVSDSVKGTLGRRPCTDESGRLIGGSMTLPEAGRAMAMKGIDEALIGRSMWENPAGYLARAGFGSTDLVFRIPGT